MNSETAIAAIRARINGEFDHPALVAIGPLSTYLGADISEILRHVTAPEVAYSPVQVECALCVWEWMNDRHGMTDAPEGATKDLLDLWEAMGAGQMRNLAARVAPALEALYTSRCAEVGEDDLRLVFMAYDWEFIPAACALLDWSGAMKAACYTSDLIDLPEAVRPAMLAEFVSAIASMPAGSDLALYMGKARRAAGRLWGYVGLVDDDSESIRRGFADGADPIELVRKLGIELDLSEPDPITQAALNKQFPVNF